MASRPCPCRSPKKLFFHPLNGKVSHGRGDADVDPDVARRRFVAEAARSGSARREQRRLIAVGTTFQEGQRFVQAAGVNEAQHGTENLRVGDLAGGWHIVEDRRLHEVSRFVLRNLRVAPVQQELSRPAFHRRRSDDSTRSLLCGVITGPICMPSSRPLPTFSFDAASAIESRKRFLRLANGDRD